MKQRLLAGAIALLLFACKKENTTPKTTPAGSVVYVSGTVVQPSNNAGTPCVWKDGVRIDLPIPDGAYGGGATMVQSGNDLYVVGTLYNQGTLKAVYWKNGTRVDLLPVAGYFDATANGIFVSGNDVYVCGASQNGSTGVPTLWKNNQPTAILDVLDQYKNSVANAMSVNGTDVYLVGYSQEGTKKVPVYWKNGVLHRLFAPNMGSYCLPNSIAFEGNTRYIGGITSDPYDQHWGGKIWKDDLDGYDIKNNEAQDNRIDGTIMAAGGSIYSAGFFTVTGRVDQPCYWKNGDVTILNPVEAGKPSRAASIKVVNDVVYVSGWGYDIRGIKRAGYWKNGVFTTLPPVSDLFDAYPYDILIGN